MIEFIIVSLIFLVGGIIIILKSKDNSPPPEPINTSHFRPHSEKSGIRIIKKEENTHFAEGKTLNQLWNEIKEENI